MADTLGTISDAGLATSTHEERTRNIRREPHVFDAAITQIGQETPTIKRFTLKVLPNASERFTFQPGQWVDCFLPGISTVGGFSICSTPRQLDLTESLELAVKYTSHPPAEWLHSQAKQGDTIRLRAGGEFSLQLTSDIESRGGLLFIAGGVGINPLYSMIASLTEMAANRQRIPPTLMLYSAKTADELAFGKELVQMSESHEDIGVRLFVTGAEAEKRHLAGASLKTEERKIDTEILREAIEHLVARGAQREAIHSYVCGPPKMIDGVKERLVELGSPEPHVHFEKWW